jgi:transcriptional regulator with XRE-family HTH domain
MGAQRLTNVATAKKAGVGVMTVSNIRNGKPTVSYVTLKKVVEAIGLTMAEVSTPVGELRRAAVDSCRIERFIAPIVVRVLKIHIVGINCGFLDLAHRPKVT